MRVKETVSLVGLGLEMERATELVEACYKAIGCECWITSGTERETRHRGQPVEGGAEDPHYEGKALDFRIWNVPKAQREALLGAIRSALGDRYVVLWESRGLPNEHFHVQAGHIAVA